MTTFWNFPAAKGGMINSINNAGLETFRGNTLDSLTREICQNSLDAVKDTNQPVIVEFKSFSCKKDALPKIDELIQAFHLCGQTWTGHNKKSEEFVQNALAILNKEEIPFLRISDFNTKGLEGARDGLLGSPWSSLIKEAGSSNKDESSGGSFGIGKSAPFLNSNLRTLFYSSLDVTDYESHIGVANIMSFKKNRDEITLGTGYYTNSPDSLAIPGQLHLDHDFTRTETGTDIYVSAFEPVEDWKEEVKKSILFNFFITVSKKKLIVRINNFEINDKNIEQLILNLDDTEENRMLKNYFTVLTSPNTIKVPYPATTYRGKVSFEEGEAHLYLLNGEDLNRRILMTRTTGMRIFEQKNISGSISFTGLLMITGSHMNPIFKQMENPAHNEWAPERYEKDPKWAKKVYSDLRYFIRATVKSHFQEQITDEMDAAGVSDFLPNKSFLTGQSTNKSESLNASIKTIITKQVKQEKSKSSKPKGKSLEEMEEQLAGEFGITPTGDKGGNQNNNDSSGGNNAGGAADPGGLNEVNPDQQGEGDTKKKRKPSKDPIEIKQKYVCTDKKNGTYKFNIVPDKTLSSGRLVFRVMGEQSNYDIPIKAASTNHPDVTIERFSSNTVYVNSLKKNKSFMINVDIDYWDYCVLEVELYEN